MKTKVKRLNFTVSAEIDNLIRNIQKKTDMSLVVILTKALKLLADEKGVQYES